MLRIHYRHIGILLLTILVLALTATMYRYENPPVFVLEEPEGEYDIATMQQMLGSLHLEAMMDTFGLRSEDYVDCTDYAGYADTEDEELAAVRLAVYDAIGMDEIQKLHQGGTYRAMVLAQRDDLKQAILLWQDIHAINHCYVAEETEPGKYVIKQHRRTFGTRFEFKLRN